MIQKGTMAENKNFFIFWSQYIIQQTTCLLFRSTTHDHVSNDKIIICKYITYKLPYLTNRNASRKQNKKINNTYTVIIDLFENQI